MCPCPPDVWAVARAEDGGQNVRVNRQSMWGSAYLACYARYKRPFLYSCSRHAWTIARNAATEKGGAAPGCSRW